MGQDNYKIYLEVASNAADEAGKLLFSCMGQSRHIDYKGRIDLVTEMDRESEKLILSIIEKEFPSHNILAEEGGGKDTGSEYTWIVDPLDGTTNYAHGFGFFAVSIALEQKGKGIVAGAVNAPYLDEFYRAMRGGGAFLNDNKIHVSNTDDLERSMLATGFPYDVKETRANIDFFSRFVVLAQAVRRPGSAAIDICAVAAGKFDGFWELDLHPWDTAAGSLILTESGGRITDLSGGNFDYYKRELLASNGLIHEHMRKVINNV